MAQIFPTSYFGNLSYYAALIQEPSIVIEAKEHFIKQTYRNRCEVLTGNGVQAISIPVIRKNGSKTSIDEVEISNDTDWRKDHWKAIESAYSNSPYFDHYGIEVKELIYNQETNLLKFNENIHQRICLWLGIETQHQFSSEFLSSSESTYHFNVNPAIKNYIQVFVDTNSFIPNLSILDAIFCLGPMARKLLTN
jgi:hypothetical protein